MVGSGGSERGREGRRTSQEDRWETAKRDTSAIAAGTLYGRERRRSRTGAWLSDAQTNAKKRRPPNDNFLPKSEGHPHPPSAKKAKENASEIASQQRKTFMLMDLLTCAHLHLSIRTDVSYLRLGRKPTPGSESVTRKREANQC